MARWIVVDSLSCDDQLFGSHLSSYSHYLNEAGETAWPIRADFWQPGLTTTFARPADIGFFLDRYSIAADALARGECVKAIAQVAALCSPMPWDVRNPDGSCVFSAVISSIPWMAEEANKHGTRGVYMPLAFDLRARVCMMGVKRDLDCIFIGSTGPNHRRRTELLRELADVVTVLPPVYGREYFKTLARAKVVFSPHAEWARGAANNMRCFESEGLGASVVFDGEWPDGVEPFGYNFDVCDADSARQAIKVALLEHDSWIGDTVLIHHVYENRVPMLISLAKGLR